MKKENMKKPEEMTMGELIDEATKRIVAAKTTIRDELDAAMAEGGTKENPKFDKVAQKDIENNRRIHDLRAEMMKRGMQWFDIYYIPKNNEGELPNA